MSFRRRWQPATAAIICCLGGSLLTRATVGGSESADKAKSLTHLLEEHYRLPRTLKAVFLERFSEGPKQARIESGTVYFRRPGQMRWEYEAPEKKLFLVDGKTAWFYVPFDHTVTKTPVKESSDWRTPLALLTRKPDLSRLCNRIEVISQEGVPPGHAVLRCQPKGADDSAQAAKSSSAASDSALSGTERYTAVLLEVDEESGELARIEVEQAGGIELEFRFGNWQTDIPLSADLFRFQVPPGVAIVDGTARAQNSN